VEGGGHASWLSTAVAAPARRTPVLLTCAEKRSSPHFPSPVFCTSPVFQKLTLLCSLLMTSQLRAALPRLDSRGPSVSTCACSGAGETRASGTPLTAAGARRTACGSRRWAPVWAV
jgi:hypothetical protein